MYILKTTVLIRSNDDFSKAERVTLKVNVPDVIGAGALSYIKHTSAEEDAPEFTAWREAFEFVCFEISKQVHDYASSCKYNFWTFAVELSDCFDVVDGYPVYIGVDLDMKLY